MDNNIIEKNIAQIETDNIKAEFYKKFMECLNHEDLRLCPSTPKDIVLFKYDLDKFTMEDVEELVKYLEKCFSSYEIVAIPKENQIQIIPRNELIEFLEKTIKDLKKEQ